MNRRISIRQVRNKYATMRRMLPKQLANLSLNHFKASFREGGFYDSYFKAWKPRKYADKNRSRRAILVKSGALRRSLEIRETSFKQIRVGSYTIDYSSVHNKGLGRMPKRQFIGKSKLLRKKFKEKIRQHLKNIFK